MAVSTIKATIQMRKGLERDFDADKMTAGEWAVSIDTKYVRMCFASGIVIRMATYEAFEQDMIEIQTILATCQDIQVAVERFVQLAEQHESQAEIWSNVSKSWAVGGTGTRTGEDTNNSKYWSQQSKNEADRAKEEADRAASIAGITIDSELSETSLNPVQNKVITNALNNIDVDINSKAVNFTEATTRINIGNGEKIPILFGKIRKWFTDISNGAASTLLGANLTSNRVLLSDASGKIAASSITSTILGYLSGVTSNVQTQLNGKINTNKIVTSTSITSNGYLMDGKTASDAIAALNKKLPKYDYISVSGGSIAAGGSNPNVNKQYTPPTGYEVKTVAVSAGSGCMASGYYSTGGKNLTAVVVNPTTVTRTPAVNFYIILQAI